MLLKFTRHCQHRMMERGIDAEHVKKALKAPDFKKPTYEDKVLVRKKIGKKTLEVIYFKDGFRDKKNEYIIVTAYYLENK